MTVISIHSFMGHTSDGVHLLDRAVNLGLRSIGPFPLDLFFVLSGYLITSILYSTRGSTRPFLTFYARRALRIAPLYFLYLAVIPVIFSKAGVFAVGTPALRAWNWVFATNILMTRFRPDQIGFVFGHLWTLSIEEHFYLLWPLIVLLTSVKTLPRVCVALIGLSVVARVILVANGVGYYGWLLMPTRMDGLAAGSLVAIVQMSHPENLQHVTRRVIVVASLAALVTFSVVIFMSFVHTNPGLYASYGTKLRGRQIEIALGPFVGGIAFAVCVARFALSPGKGPRFLRSRFLRSIGRSSYGMYLFHVPLGAVLFVITPLRVPVWGLDFPYQVVSSLVLIGVSFGVGTLTWNYFEKPILKLAPAYRFAEPRDNAWAGHLV